MAKRKNKVNDKMLGIMIGIAVTISAIGVINSVSVSFAHGNEGISMDNNMMHSMMGGSNGMMSGSGMSMMHTMMMGENGGMGGGMMECMKMMGQAADDGEITQAEMDEMMKQMDKDGDGLCDYCGMPLEMCRKMMSS